MKHVVDPPDRAIRADIDLALQERKEGRNDPAHEDPGLDAFEALPDCSGQAVVSREALPGELQHLEALELPCQLTRELVWVAPLVEPKVTVTDDLLEDPV